MKTRELLKRFLRGRLREDTVLVVISNVPIYGMSIYKYRLDKLREVNQSGIITKTWTMYFSVEDRWLQDYEGSVIPMGVRHRYISSCAFNTLPRKQIDEL